MTKRSIRRAAERLAQKQAEKQALSNGAHTTAAAAPAISEARLAANQANAQLSSGPKTPAGKAISSLNAVKTGLTGRTILLPSDDAAEYQAHVLAYRDRFNPVGHIECELVQSIADVSWRLRRVTSLEHGIYAVGRRDFADQFADIADPRERAALVDLETSQARAKQLRNLHLQEARLTRYRNQDIAELRQLQQERNQKREDALKEAAARFVAARESGTLPYTPVENGFVFSTDEIEHFLASQPTVADPKNRERSVPAAA